jgi:hypothetical protein
LRRTEYTARKRAGILAMIEDGLAAHDHVLDAFRTLPMARRAVRAITSDLVFPDADPGEVEERRQL